MLHPVCQQSPQGGPQNCANAGLAEDRLFLTSEGGTSTTSFSHLFPSGDQSCDALGHVQKVPETTQHVFCLAKL